MMDQIRRSELVALLVKLRSATGWLVLFVSAIALDKFIDAVRTGDGLAWSLFGVNSLVAAYWCREWWRATKAVDILAAGEKASDTR